MISNVLWKIIIAIDIFPSIDHPPAWNGTITR